MTVASLQPLLPLVALGTGATALLLQIAFLRNVKVTGLLATAFLLGAALSCVYAGSSGAAAATPLLQADAYAMLFCGLFCLSGAVTVLLSRVYISYHGDQPEEYFLLLVLATLGACLLAYAVHVASLLLGLELLSVSLYALIAYPNRSILPLEAAIKYLVLSVAASATALFGFALLYMDTGALGFVAIGAGLTQADSNTVTQMVAAAMIVAGLGFKLSLVPFHLWTPDVYDGAPAPITGFLATVSKAAVFAVVLRFFLDADLFRYDMLIRVIGLMAIVSMLAGNLLALLQTNIKRILAYSSIAHIGYLSIIFMVSIAQEHRQLATQAAIYYLVAYTATTISAFGLLTLVSERSDERESVDLQHITGLFWRQPIPACLLLAALLSLAGIPLTAGFMAKFYIITAAVSGSHWILLTALVTGSGIGIYYYLRVVYHMACKPTGPQVQTMAGAQGRTTLVLCGLLIVAIIFLGVMPQPLAGYLQSIL